MYHSIYFEDEKGNVYNTLQTFHLLSDSRPIIKPPELKTEYVDIPGADGTLDYTEALNGLTYKNRTGSWEFYVLNEQYGNSETAWANSYTNLLELLHGKKFKKVYLEDETDDDGFPIYYYVGRITVNEWRSDPQFSKVVLDYDLETRKYKLPKSSKAEWLWDDLFDSESVTPIQYGKFTVNGTKMRNFINGSDSTIPATVECKTAVKAIRMSDNHVIQFNPGSNQIELSVGDNIYKFEGASTIMVYYSNGGRFL